MKIFKKPIFVSISPNAQADDVWLALKLFFMPWKWKDGKDIGELENLLSNYLDKSSLRGANRQLAESDEAISSEEEVALNDLQYSNGIATPRAGRREARNDNLTVVTFESGRTALYAILQALGIGEGDEVLIQAFTCTAAVNPILWVGAKPIYVDVSAGGETSPTGGEDGTYNISLEDLEKKITPKSKVVIIQHTFGFPAKVDEIIEIAKKNNLIVLEDCAHSLGAEYKGRKVGVFGKASFFSFGRSKIISSVFGGAVFTKDQELAKNIRMIQQKWSYPSYRWIAQQLFHPIYLVFAKLLYNFFSIGKFMIILAKKLKLISLMVYSVEKSGGKPPFGPAKMPNALAVLALNQMKKLDKFNEYRQEIAKCYSRELCDIKNIKCHPEFISGSHSQKDNEDNDMLNQVQHDDGKEKQSETQPVYLNFPIQVKNFGMRWKLIGEAKKQGIYLESWPAKDKKVIGPDSVCQEKLFYNEGECPVAEKTAQISINLPTHPNVTRKDAERVVEFIKQFAEHHM